MTKHNYCKDCHFWDRENPFELSSNGKYYPCHNIGVDGWEYWDENQKEPEHCSAYCKRGEYVPTGIWADMAKIVKAVADEIKKGE